MTAAGIRTAASAFRSQGRSAIILERLTRFDVPAGQESLARFAALRPHGFTRLGAVVRHATRTLIRDAGTGHRLLLVLSDGLDHDYDGSHARADAAIALIEARRLDIRCLCLSVGLDADNHDLRHIFGAADYARYPSWEHLQPELPAVLRVAVDRPATPR
jgi:nitric oxide reductase activation protein